MNTNQHVVPYNGTWAVKSEGNLEPMSVHRLQSDAIKEARKPQKLLGIW